MIDKIIKQLICAAIESFPIDEKKKLELLRDIIDGEIPIIRQKGKEP